MTSSAIRKLAINIRALRKAAGISQAELAEQVRVHKSYISRLEDSQGNPTLASLERIAQALDIDLETLFK